MITKLTKHDSHQVSVYLCKTNSKHYAELRCQDCNIHIQWLNKQDVEELKNLSVNVKPRPLLTALDLGI